ncbi:hypothetical protein [Salegentibacter salinarum]|uniref:hypothetical protein n=1 Tax=Salegentibacter salinarum TaxID=447422 RepID=UPI0018E32847|nr:hypothetical protein [Salegentibacter salinarum]
MLTRLRTIGLHCTKQYFKYCRHWVSGLGSVSLINILAQNIVALCDVVKHSIFLKALFQNVMYYDIDNKDAATTAAPH